MLTMQPIMMIAEGQDGQGMHRYRVRFDKDGSEVEYVFTVDDTGIACATGEDEFIKATFCDPFVPELYRSILKFHKARGLEQLQEQTERTPEEKRDTT